MKFLIATAALFCSLVLARPGKFGVGDYSYAGCTIIGEFPTPIYSEPFEDFDVCRSPLSPFEFRGPC